MPSAVYGNSELPAQHFWEKIVSKWLPHTNSPRAERECEKTDGNAKGLISDRAPAKEGWKYFTSSFKPKEKYGVLPFAPSTGRVCAVNFAN